MRNVSSSDKHSGLLSSAYRYSTVGSRPVKWMDQDIDRDLDDRNNERLGTKKAWLHSPRRSTPVLGPRRCTHKKYSPKKLYRHVTLMVDGGPSVAEARHELPSCCVLQLFGRCCHLRPIWVSGRSKCVKEWRYRSGFHWPSYFKLNYYRIEISKFVLCCIHCVNKL